MKIPNRVDVLLLAHPRPLSDIQTYAVDQFVMRGGRVIAFLDPQSEVSLTAGPNGEPLRGYSEQSDMPVLMRQWGVRMLGDMIVADRKRAQRVAAGRDARRALTDYILWMGLGPSEMNGDDPVTGNIDRLNIGTVGALRPLDGASTSFTPLVTSSDDAGLMTRDYVLSAPPPMRCNAVLRSVKRPMSLPRASPGRLSVPLTHRPKRRPKKASAPSRKTIKTAQMRPILLSLPIAIFSMTGFGCRNKIISASVLACRLPIMVNFCSMRWKISWGQMI